MARTLRMLRIGQPFCVCIVTPQPSQLPAAYDLMGFQDDFGDQAPDDSTQMVKLEKNYRSTATILEAAISIANSSERIDKVLRPTRGEELITLTCDDEIAEAGRGAPLSP